MKLIGLLAFCVLVLLVFWLMYGERTPPRKAGDTDFTGLPSADVAGPLPHDHDPHGTHPADATEHGGFDGGGHH